VICSTNAIESLNAQYRRAVRARGHFPTEQAALKCLYLVTRSLDPTGRDRTRWTMRWKPALNALPITFHGRWPAAETYSMKTAGNTVTETVPDLGVTPIHRYLFGTDTTMGAVAGENRTYGVRRGCSFPPDGAALLS
jgi:hypothetical protein